MTSIIRDICVGKTSFPIGQLQLLWTSNFTCWNAFDDHMFKLNGRPGYNADNFSSMNDYFSYLLNYYLEQGYSISQPGSNSYNAFQQVLQTACTRYPGACGNFLTSWCANNATADSASTNTGLMDFCGCYVKDQSWTEFGEKVECQPLCHRVSTIKLPDGTGSYSTCTSNVCIIDNVAINAARTDGRRTNVSFTQVCRCPEGQCKCILSNTNLYGLVGNVSFNQVCADNSACYTVSDNPNQPPTQIPCPTIVTPEDSSETIVDSTSIYLPWIIMIIVVVIIFLFMVIS